MKILKNSWLIVLFMGAMLTLNAQERPVDDEQKVVIRGTVKGPWQGHSVNLYNNITGDAGSAKIVDGKFELIVPYTIPTRQMFSTSYDTQVRGGYAPFGILVQRPGIIEVELDIEKGFSTATVVKGSEPHELYVATVSQLRRGQSPEEQAAILAAAVSDNPSSYAALFILDRHGNTIPVDQRERLFASLDPQFKTLREWGRIEGKISGDKSAQVGSLVANFTLQTPEGESLSFEQFRGKWVYLNFWASWCGPCHAEFPQLKEIYAAYKDDGFEILGVSTDKNHEAWLKDLEKIQLPWPQVVDREDPASVSLSQFAVSALPTSFLIDPEGRIVVKGLRVPQLEEELRKALN